MHKMPRLVVIFLFLASAFFSASGICEQNVIEGHAPTVLASSKTIAQLGGDTDSDLTMRKKAKQICHKLGMSLARVTPHKMSETEAQAIVETKTYHAHSIEFTEEGFIFKSGNFRLEPWPQKISRTECLENFFLHSTFVILVGGGLSTLLLVTGFEGPPDYFAATISGCITGGLSILSTAGCAITRLVRKKFDDNAPKEIADLGSLERAELYAQPILIDELWCK